jgi:hypothetical protein
MGADPAPHIIRSELTSGGSMKKFTALTSVNPSPVREQTRPERQYDFTVVCVWFCQELDKYDHSRHPKAENTKAEDRFYNYRLTSPIDDYPVTSFSSLMRLDPDANAASHFDTSEPTPSQSG